MQIQIFNIPLTDTGEALSEMNRFMTGRKVLEVEQRFFQNEKGGGWSFCVRYLPDVTQSGATGSRAKVDYKQFQAIPRNPRMAHSLAIVSSELCGLALIIPCFSTDVNRISPRISSIFSRQLCRFLAIITQD